MKPGKSLPIGAFIRVKIMLEQKQPNSHAILSEGHGQALVDWVPSGRPSNRPNPTKATRRQASG
jgi:hypothetical protein